MTDLPLDPATLMATLDAGPVPLSTLHNVSLTGADRFDLTMADGLVTGILPAGTVPPGPGSIEVDGYLVTAAAADAHAHLDEALSLDGLVAGEHGAGYGDLHRAIAQWQLISESADDADYYRRARSAALEMLGNGVTAIRSHCNLNDGPDPFVGLHALMRVRNELRPLMDIEIAIRPAPWSPTADIAGAMAAGADIVGAARIWPTTRWPSWSGWSPSRISSASGWTSTPTSSSPPGCCPCDRWPGTPGPGRSPTSTCRAGITRRGRHGGSPRSARCWTPA